ncbi:MAG: plasma-membrane choline transporter-domain-containing protein [Piptocephalis tieghemiana]|nr:MAG: plasma-membrane choline transporter-domain-containing protein [Piptocephalis tieghemiana]
MNDKDGTQADGYTSSSSPSPSSSPDPGNHLLSPTASDFEHSFGLAQSIAWRGHTNHTTEPNEDEEDGLGALEENGSRGKSGDATTSLFYSMRGSIFDPYHEADLEEDAEVGGTGSIEEINLDPSTQATHPVRDRLSPFIPGPSPSYLSSPPILPHTSDASFVTQSSLPSPYLPSRSTNRHPVRKFLDLNERVPILSSSKLFPSPFPLIQRQVADVYAERPPPSHSSTRGGRGHPAYLDASFSSASTSMPMDPRRDSMTDQLLPGSSTRRSPRARGLRSNLPLTQALPFFKDVRYRDPVFLMLYLLAMVIFALSGIILLISTHSSSLTSIVPWSFFSILTDRLGLIASLMTGAFVIGAIWLYILRNQVRALIRINLLILPPLLLTCGIWMMTDAFASRSFTGESEPNWLMVIAATIPLLGGPIMAIYVKRRWDRLEKSMAVLDLSLTILKENPDLIATGLLLTGVWSIFSAVWLILFSRIALLGNTGVSGENGRISLSWDSSSWVLTAFYLICFFWTAGVLNDVQRITTGKVVADWYFHREDTPMPSCGRATPALLQAFTHQLGTASLAALTLSLSRGLYLSSWLIRRVSRFSVALTFLQGMARWLARSTAGVTALAPSYAGISGLPFCASTTAITRALRRNVVLLNLGTDTLVRILFSCSSFLLATLASLSVYTATLITSDDPKGDQGGLPSKADALTRAAIVAALSGAVQFFVSRFYTRTLSAISDAAFLCWTIDLDEHTNRCPEAHQAFAPGYSDHVLS